MDTTLNINKVSEDLNEFLDRELAELTAEVAGTFKNELPELLEMNAWEITGAEIENLYEGAKVYIVFDNDETADSLKLVIYLAGGITRGSFQVESKDGDEIDLTTEDGDLNIELLQEILDEGTIAHREKDEDYDGDADCQAYPEDCDNCDGCDDDDGLKLTPTPTDDFICDDCGDDCRPMEPGDSPENFAAIETGADDTVDFDSLTENNLAALANKSLDDADDDDYICPECEIIDCDHCPSTQD